MIMETALPMANMMTQKRFHTVPAMFVAATTVRPRVE